MITFPEKFLWGSASSAPQTEGHPMAHGKSESTWDKWYELHPEKFNNDEGPTWTSNVYEMYKEDIKRMKDIGLNSYRTSISWTRLIPDGKTINEEAVKFYRDYFKRMQDNGIRPFVNLFHFDMPWWLMEKGGWESRASVDAFAFYAKTAFEKFGDIVKDWITFNEPLVHVECGYLYGQHYPGIINFKKAIQVGYHTLMAHFYAVKCFRDYGISGKIGIILNVTPTYAKSENKFDQEAKRKADLLNIKSFLDPCVLGMIPQELRDLLYINNLNPITFNDDNNLIANFPVDFVGINYYQPMRVQAPRKSNCPALLPTDFYDKYDWKNKRINPYRGWEIYPRAIYDIAIMMKNEYQNIPWYVSENGIGVSDEERFMDNSGMIIDEYRIDFIKDHLEQLNKGIQQGSNCFGYHTWTFIDCWSWLNGYKNRYGFYRVDLENKFKRSLKKSGLWFKGVSTNNGFYL